MSNVYNKLLNKYISILSSLKTLCDRDGQEIWIHLGPYSFARHTDESNRTSKQLS